LALLVFLIPGVNLTVFFVANGYLLGREYFEFAAMRHLPINEAKALRRKNGMTVFVGGLIIAGVMAIPLVNLLTPLFATAFMVHIYKRQIDHSSANR
jgi:CysZ protein